VNLDSRRSMKPEHRKPHVELIKSVKPKQIVEIGSWYGQSAISFLQIARENNINSRILCVDTWLGSREHWKLNSTGEWGFNRLLILNGVPNFFEEFKKRIKDSGFASEVDVLRCESKNSGEYLKIYFGNADFSYIDGDHSFTSTYLNIKLIQNSCSKATIAGDDYGWSSVKLAVNIYALIWRFKILLDIDKGTWVLIGKSNSCVQKELEFFGWQAESNLEKIKILKVGLKMFLSRAFSEIR
jgi:hypothetical protein